MSELQIINSSESIYSVDKDLLIFPINSQTLNDFNKSTSLSKGHTTILSETRLQVTNLTSEYLAFRIKTTKKKNYAVNPTYTIIAPKRTQEVEIGFYICQGETIDEKGHKFKLEGFNIDISQKNSNPKEIFQDVVERNEQVQGTVKKLLVKFTEDNDYNCYLNMKQGLQSGNNNNEEDNNNNNLAKSVYSVAQDNLAAPMKKSTVLRGGMQKNFAGGDEEMLEMLKNENQKLKDQMDNLNLNCSKLKQRIESEKKSPNQSSGVNSNKYIYKVPEIKEKKFSNIILIAAFIASVLFGFYLTK